MRPQAAFQAMLKGNDFDVAEMSLANYTCLKARGPCPFVGIPVMLSKMFRHSCIYVRSDAAIHTPADLKHKRAGTAQFSSTGVVFAKGMLQDDYGVRQDDLRWWIGPLHAPNAAPAPQTFPDGLEVHRLGDGETLEGLLEAGKLDVIFSNHFPSLWLRRWPGIRRLFGSYKATEQDYFRRTGIFPVMHTLVIREDVYREHPFVGKALFDACEKARDAALFDLYDTDALRVTLPWLIDHVEEARSTFGEEAFLYGLESNRPAITALSRYLFEQALAPRMVPPEELFVTV
jgi:4,5-dihydroxyphthalate decarboxylase